MSNLRRYDSYGKPYFITSVTYKRLPYLLDNESLLLQTFQRAQNALNFEMIAWVILVEHFHIILDTPNVAVSRIMHWIKQSFSLNYRKTSGIVNSRIWQYRFWDHIILSCF
jgi:REP element-mobilizing transposase RayT